MGNDGPYKVVEHPEFGLIIPKLNGEWFFSFGVEPIEEEDRCLAEQYAKNLNFAWKEGRASRDGIVRHARYVMELLQKHGRSIVPHLLDNGHNDGEFLRKALAEDSKNVE